MRLREIREDRDLTQSQVAQILNCKQIHINNTKAGNAKSLCNF